MLVTVKILLNITFTIGVTLDMSIVIDTLQTAIQLTLTIDVGVVFSLPLLVSFLLVESFNGKSHEVGLDINCILKRRIKHT